MFAEEIKNKLSALASKGMDGWENHRPEHKTMLRTRPIKLKRESLDNRTVQLKLFEK